jgi:DNA-binding MarR family transcriptional regulator
MTASHHGTRRHAQTGPSGPPRRPALETLRRLVLESLAGPTPRPPAEIPRPRPFTRAQVEGVVRMLMEEGLVARVPSASGRRPIAYGATVAGREAMDAQVDVPQRGDAAA